MATILHPSAAGVKMWFTGRVRARRVGVLMKCPRCQQESPSDADFCPECGERLAVVCVACGTANAPTHKFCKKCGQALEAAAGPGEANAPSSAVPT